MSVRVSRLCLQIGSFRLGPLNFSAGSSGIYILRGPNGSGKTSLLRTFMGRLRPASGSITGFQMPLAAIGVEGFLMEPWTVKENLEWLAHLLQETPQLDDAESLRALAPMPIAHLSQGMKRQIELELALAFPFPSLILDESFAPLDEGKRARLLSRLEKAASHRFILMTAHRPEDLPVKAAGIWTL